jgi:hypothetical protein
MTALRTLTRLPRARIVPAFFPVSRRWATQSYGNEQSGHPGSDAAPRRDVEHPGPSAPDTSGGKSNSSSSGQSSGQPSSTSMSHSGASSDKGRPAIHQPESAAEADDPEVKKHNEEMRNRAEVSANQLSEDDNKVSG